MIKVTTMFAPTPETEKMDRGKYTKCIVRTLPVRELVMSLRDFGNIPLVESKKPKQRTYCRDYRQHDEEEPIDRGERAGSIRPL